MIEVPVPEGRYADLVATSERLFLLRRPLRGMAGGGDENGEGRLGKVVAFDVAAREEKAWADGVGAMTLSADGKQLLLRGDGELRLVSAAKPPQSPSAGRPIH